MCAVRLRRRGEPLAMNRVLRVALSCLILPLALCAASCRRKQPEPKPPRPAVKHKAPGPEHGKPRDSNGRADKALIEPCEDISSDADKMIEKYYPCVSGLPDPAVETAVNASIRRAADMSEQTRLLMEDKGYNPQFSSEASATYNRNGILSVSVFQTFMSAGAQNETFVQDARTFRLSDGAELKLADLFTPGSDWSARINRAVRSHVAAQDIRLLREYEGVTAPGDKSGFYLNEQGIVVFYQAYDYTSYMDGILAVTVPWGDVSDILAMPLK